MEESSLIIEIILGVVLLVLILFCIGVYQFIRMNKAEKLTDEEIQKIKARYIIKHKEFFDKMTIQKAQQQL